MASPLFFRKQMLIIFIFIFYVSFHAGELWLILHSPALSSGMCIIQIQHYCSWNNEPKGEISTQCIISPGIQQKINMYWPMSGIIALLTMSVEAFSLQAEGKGGEAKADKAQCLSSPHLHQFLRHIGGQFLADFIWFWKLNLCCSLYLKYTGHSSRT